MRLREVVIRTDKGPPDPVKEDELLLDLRDKQEREQSEVEACEEYSVMNETDVRRQS